MSKNTQNKRIKRSITTASSVLPYQKGVLGVNEASISVLSPNLFSYLNTSTVSFLSALLLCLSFFLQGINYAEAETISSDGVSEVTPEIEVEPTPEPDSASEYAVESDSSDSPTDHSILEESVATDFGSEFNSDDLLPTEDEDLSTSDITENVDETTDEIINSNFEETLSEENQDVDRDSNNDEEDALVDTENSELIEEDLIEISGEQPTATTTEGAEELPGTTESVSVVQSDTAYTFNREECTLLATGSYYCLKPVENILDDALFSAPDEDGDLEIFLVRGGVQSQVTVNQVDDAAPYFDENSNTIVWHRLYNDRFQIVSYEIESGNETFLTSTSENNMEPTRQGQYTVWQRWVDGAWNIILHDGQKEKKITNGAGHNVAPYVHGSLVVWNRHNQDGQKTIEMYDIDTSSYVSVPDAEGLSVSNPRMLFVFDSLTPEGDVITKGYDVLSRKFIDLDSLPKNLPDEIPNSESTGETRALIQSKPTVKTEVEELIESEIDPPIIDPNLESAELTLDLSTTTSLAPVAEPIVVPTELDLVIPPYNAENVSSTSEQIIE